MLRSCEYDGRRIDFSTGADDQIDTNRFTVIVGKNGTGKSRLLRAIVGAFVNVIEPERRDRSISGILKRRPEMSVSCDSVPGCVIALSTSPFDRFPIKREIEEGEGYQYLGLRGLGSNNLSLSFMSRTFGALLRAVTFDRAHAATIQTVLGYLGYYGFIEARFVCSLTRRRLDEMLQSDDPVASLLAKDYRSTYSLQEDRFAHNLGQMSQDEICRTLEVLRRWYSDNPKPRLDLRIDVEGVYNLSAKEYFDESLLPLFKLGFFQLRDVGLQKVSHDTLIRISDASSGEQCVVMALLGIASHIQDGTLICIDEPENCLHPEWQERYIELLMTTFGQFKNCHFIIATHSPQVVAKLHDQNCFVVDLESGSTTPASVLNGRSADFQLAHVFKVPGARNEYLSRVFFNALRVIGSGNELQKDKADEATRLLLLKESLGEEDPVKGLMEIFEKSLAERKCE